MHNPEEIVLGGKKYTRVQGEMPRTLGEILQLLRGAGVVVAIVYFKSRKFAVKCVNGDCLAAEFEVDEDLRSTDRIGGFKKARWLGQISLSNVQCLYCEKSVCEAAARARTKRFRHVGTGETFLECKDVLVLLDAKGRRNLIDREAVVQIADAEGHMELHLMSAHPATIRGDIFF